VGRIREGDFSLDGDVWDQVSPEAKDIILQMLCKEDVRLSAAEAFQHPWFEFTRQLEQQRDATAVHQRDQNVARALANLKSFSSKNKVK